MLSETDRSSAGLTSTGLSLKIAWQVCVDCLPEAPSPERVSRKATWNCPMVPGAAFSPAAEYRSWRRYLAVRLPTGWPGLAWVGAGGGAGTLAASCARAEFGPIAARRAANTVAAIAARSAIGRPERRGLIRVPFEGDGRT